MTIAVPTSMFSTLVISQLYKLQSSFLLAFSIVQCVLLVIYKKTSIKKMHFLQDIKEVKAIRKMFRVSMGHVFQQMLRQRVE